MPKRSCPFSDTFCCQYKVHIGQMEMNHYGVFGVKYRQEVYEKTKNLLFNGTKAVTGRSWRADGEEKVSDETSVSSAPGHQTLLKGQMLISTDGRLKKANALPGCAAAATACCVCQRVSGSRQPCMRCERSACVVCTQQCASCYSHCCTLCAVTDYSERYDRILCVSCSS